jgi:hypothetical protein
MTAATQRKGGQGAWRIFRWPLVMAIANAIGLIAALVGNGWYDFLSWATLGGTIVVMVAAWLGYTAET